MSTEKFWKEGGEWKSSKKSSRTLLEEIIELLKYAVALVLTLGFVRLLNSLAKDLEDDESQWSRSSSEDESESSGTTLPALGGLQRIGRTTRTTTTVNQPPRRGGALRPQGASRTPQRSIFRPPEG